MFRRRIGDLENEAARYKAESQRIKADISRTQNDLLNELSLKSQCDAEKLYLEDQLASLKHTRKIFIRIEFPVSCFCNLSFLVYTCFR